MKQVKTKKRSGYNESTFCKTSDNWWPCCKDNTVEVSLHIRSGNQNHWVSVWGDDDIGMDKEFPKGTTREEVLSFYRKLCLLPDIKISHLKELGFEQG